MRPARHHYSDRARHDLNRFFCGWLIAANLCWLITPWPDTLAPTWGPAWLWTGVIPAASLAALNPRRVIGLLLATVVLAWRLATQLGRPCRFLTAR